jgi:hypothetical protein
MPLYILLPPLIKTRLNVRKNLRSGSSESMQWRDKASDGLKTRIRVSVDNASTWLVKTTSHLPAVSPVSLRRMWMSSQMTFQDIQSLGKTLSLWARILPLHFTVSQR